MKKVQSESVNNHNRDLARLLTDMSDCYKYLGKEERFRALAYENAAKTILNLEMPVENYGDDIKKLGELKGIGPHIAAKIGEYIHTGKISGVDDIKRKVPFGLFSLMKIEGVGPATVRHLHEQYPADDRNELAELMRRHPVYGIKGVSRTNLEKIKKELQVDIITAKRWPFATAQAIATHFLTTIKNIPGVNRADIAGSLRRMKETIGDIDIIVATDDRRRKEVMTSICTSHEVKRVIMKGTTKATVELKAQHMQADIRIVEATQYGAAWLYLTGSKEHNIQLRKLAAEKGLKLNEYGLFNRKDLKLVAAAEEKDIYGKLGLKWILPEKRLGRNELREHLTKIP